MRRWPARPGGCGPSLVDYDAGVLKTVCVFCGSSPGADPAYLAAARGMGELLARTGRTLVFGGGHVGLMGAVADAVLEHGGKVVGVIPHALVERELAHDRVQELVITESMHERKAAMADRADAFVALPGGIGTLEEFFETWTWAQLGIHGKPLGLLNVNGFWDPLLAFLDKTVADGFLQRPVREMVCTAGDADGLLRALEGHRPAEVTRWADRSER